MGSIIFQVTALRVLKTHISMELNVSAMEDYTCWIESVLAVV